MRLTNTGDTNHKADKSPWLQILIALGVVVLLLVLAYPVLLTAISGLLQAGNPTLSLKSVAESSGPSAPFDDMMTLARREAHKIDPASELSRLYVSSPGDMFGNPYTGPVTGSLELDFTFVRPDGNEIRVTFEDASPEKTLHVDAAKNRYAKNSDYDRVIDDKESRDQAYAAFTLAPRDAVAKSWAQAREYLLKAAAFPISAVDKLQISISPLYKDPSHPGWDVTYWVRDKKESPRLNEVFSFIFSGIGGEVGTWPVDGQTGQVGQPRYITPTPAPLPPEPTSTPHATITPPQAEQIPVYPGAQNVVTPTGSLRNGEERNLSYYAPPDAGRDAVLRFYDDSLAKQQWVADEDASFSQGNSTTRFYRWSGRSSRTPYDLWLYVTVATGPSPQTGQTTVWVNSGLGRSPSASNPPIFPGSSDPTVNELTDSSVQIRTITYAAPATDMQVAAYYNDILPQVGWTVSDEADGSIDGTWTDSNGEHTDGYATFKVRVAFEGAQANQTKVVMQVSGSPLPAR